MGWNLAKMVKKADKRPLEITMLNIDEIEPNEKNFYLVEGESVDQSNEQLKASLKLFGLMTPLLVTKADVGYKIISGHRRYKCCRELHELDENQFSLIPCLIDDNVGEAAEEMKLILANSTTRKKTDWEITEEVARLKEALQKYKQEGNIVPGRIQDIIAETLDMSKSSVGRHESINKNLIDKAKEKYKSGIMPMSTAAEMATLSPEEQNELIKKSDLKLADIKRVKIKKGKGNDIKNISSSIQGKKDIPEAKQDDKKYLVTVLTELRGIRDKFHNSVKVVRYMEELIAIVKKDIKRCEQGEVNEDDK